MTSAKEQLEQRVKAGHKRVADAKRERRAIRASERAKLPTDEQRIRACLMARGHFDARGMGIAFGLALLATGVVCVRKNVGVDESQVVAAVFIAAGGALFVGVRWLVALGAPARERRMLAELGFAVAGWWNVMCLDEPHNGRLCIALHFLGDAPGETALQAIMAHAGAEPLGSNTFKSPFLVATKTPMGPGNAKAFVRFQQALLHDVLAPMHAQYRLSSVEFSILPEAKHAD